MIKKRLFFAFNVFAPWPHSLPHGRQIPESSRHLTVAFLGNVDIDPLLKALEGIPSPPILGLAGVFDHCLFLPKKLPNVAAWHISWQDDPSDLIAFHESLISWLSLIGYPTDKREWLPHVTIARRPFRITEWEHTFTALPVILGDFCLYESLGELEYVPLWTRKSIPSFIEIEHTADLAFEIHANSLNQLYRHAEIALAFKFTEFIPYLRNDLQISSLNDIIIQLNNLICKTDSNIGCPIKAVSFHGEIQEICPDILKWEMIIDV